MRLARRRIEELNEKYRAVRERHLLPVSPPAPVESARPGLDGVRAQARQACGFEGLLRGGSRDRFALVVGDTRLAGREVRHHPGHRHAAGPRFGVAICGRHGAPAQPARYDEERRRVVAGYGILQPRVAVSLSGANRSRYARLCASELGIDPYTRVVSDVYQDLFGEGSFIGKGIYEVDAFERALDGRFPDNRILSHDLLEGCYARSGLLSDVQLYEDYPSRYSADVSRRHRWIRGDWQIAHWLLPGFPAPMGAGRRTRSRRSPAGRSSTTCGAALRPPR